MNSEILIAVGTFVSTPLVTLLTIWIKDRNKLAVNGQAQQFKKENLLITTLQNDIKELRMQVAVLETRLEKKDTEIQEIQRRLNARELDYANLLKEHAELSQNHQNLQIEHDDLKKKYDETVSKLTILSMDHETLKKKAEESAKHMIADPDPVAKKENETP